MQASAITQLLLEREAKGLQIPAIARSAFAVFGGIAALDGIPSPATVRMIFIVVITIVTINTLFVVALRRRLYVTAIGWLGVAADVAIIAIYPLINRSVLASHGLHWAYGLKGLLVAVFMILIGINGMALRPAYPTAVGLAAIAVFAVMAFFAFRDPAVIWADAPSLAGPEISQGAVATQILFLVMFTAIMFFLTRSARIAVVEAAVRQAERERLLRAHENSIMEGRLDALRNLVSSLSHEMNTPLGAIKSAVETIGTAVGRLQGRLSDLDSSDPKTARLMQLIVDTSKVPTTACDRVDGIVRRLGVFAALDRSEQNDIEINDAVEQTLSHIPPRLAQNVEVVRHYQAQGHVRISVPRLNLALTTIVTNAFEAAARGGGVVQIRTEDDDTSLSIIVADNGPGLPAELAARLFEFRFERTPQRIKAGLGLPAAYSLMKKHGGDISVSSDEGEGARFTITMPRAPGPALPQ